MFNAVDPERSDFRRSPSQRAMARAVALIRDQSVRRHACPWNASSRLLRTAGSTAITMTASASKQKHRGDRALHEGHEASLRERQRLAQLLLHQPPEHEAEQHRRRLEPELDQDIADQPEERGEVHVGGIVVDRVDADAAEQQDDREHQPIGHLEQAHPQPDQRQVDDQQHQVADPHRGDHAPEQVRVLGHHQRPGDDAVDGHGADHQRHHRIGRDAERQQRDEGGLRAGIVGGLGAGHALDGAAAEAGRVLGELLLQRVGGERRQHRAVAGQDAEHRAEPGRRARSARTTGADPPATAAAGRSGFARPCAIPGFSRLRRISAMPNTPMASTAKSMPSERSASPSVRRSWPVSRSVPTVASSKPEHDHDDRLEHRAARQHDGEPEAEHHQAEILRRPEQQREPGERRADRGDHQRRHRAGEERANRGDAERDAGLALASPSRGRRGR